MDKIDEKIVKILRDDARVSFVDIAKKVDLSEAAVRRRVTNLVSSGVIRKFTIELNESDLTSAITFVSVNPSHPTSGVSTKIMAVTGVERIYETTGQSDIAVIIKGPNIAEVNKSIDEIRRLDGVLNTNTTIVLRTIR